MLIINHQNVEETIFYNKAVQQLLPEFYNTFQTWALGKKVQPLGHLSHKAILDFFENLQPTHIEILKEYFKTDIKIVSVDPHLIKNYKFSINDAEKELNEMKLGEINFFIWRDADELYFSTWR